MAEKHNSKDMSIYTGNREEMAEKHNSKGMSIYTGNREMAE